MQEITFSGLAVALGSGLAIGIQATLFTVVGRSIGPVRASLILNVTGGIVAGLIMLGVLGIGGNKHWNVPRSTLVLAVIAVTLGLFIVTGVTLAFQRTGVATGIATVFLGQMLIGIVVDALGLAGAEAVPLDLRRMLGLLVMAVAIVLLTHQK
ncbi:MAG TPA: DMT family transporter [Anaerolineales bacterium]|nr:DMT family transporter [Anaerolineales bacterium]